MYLKPSIKIEVVRSEKIGICDIGPKVGTELARRSLWGCLEFTNAQFKKIGNLEIFAERWRIDR